MITIFICALIICLNLVIALYDFSFYRMPNMLVFLFLVSYFVTMPFIISQNELIFSVGIFAAALVLGLILYRIGILGGGDTKYMAVSALWAGSDLLLFLIISTIAGIVLTVFYAFGYKKISLYSVNLWNRLLRLEKRYIALRYVWNFGSSMADHHKRPDVEKNQAPYGIAIAIGIISVLYLRFMT